jgi:UDP-N-acetyl-D-glucosamine dehydrogenase
LNERGLPVAGTRILGVGVAYKRNIGDDRESPSVDALERLARRGARIGVLDPHVPPARLQRFGYEVVEAHEHLQGWTLAVVLTDHDDLDYERVAEEADWVFDTRGVYRRLGKQPSNVIAL